MVTSVLGVGQIADDTVVEQALNELVTSHSTAGAFFDFDGVLSNIEEDAASVQPLSDNISLLRGLSDVLSRVALLSSRPAAFLYERFRNVENLEYYGLYGLERIGPSGELVTDERAVPFVEIISKLRSDATQRFAGTGVYVEDKRLSLGLHYRRAPGEEHAVREYSTAISAEYGLKLQPGRLAIELKPNLGVDKGTTLAEASSHLSNAWYFGDDTGDLPAFRHLRDRRLKDAGFSGTCVGVGNDTIVEEVHSESDIFLDSPQTLSALLELIVRRLTA